MAIDLRTTQEYLNAKLGTVGLTKQQCLARLANVSENSATVDISANIYASTTGRTAQDALMIKTSQPITAGLSKQESARRL